MEHKAAYLVVSCCFLIHVTVIGTDISFYLMHSAVGRDGIIESLVSQAVAYLLYPFVGWLADVHFTRYKFILLAFITIIVATVIAIVRAILDLFIRDNLVVTEGLALDVIYTIVGIVAIGLFESTAIQFGMDQMLEASSDQLSTFVHWYYWSSIVGNLVCVWISLLLSEYYRHCYIEPEANVQSGTVHIQTFTKSTITLAIACLQLVCASVGLCLMVYFKKHFNIDRTGNNPLKLIYKVLRYAMKHKCPERRSAFTYWEEDIPPRIDLGKSKYGGPFTTEEVEDTKTFFSILLLLLSTIGFHLIDHGYSVAYELMKTQCPSYWVMLAVADPLNVIFVITIIGVPLYEVVRKCCPNYNPSMLKRMGFGLFCCLIKEAVTIVIQTTMNGNGSCKHFDTNTINSCYFLTMDLNINGTCSSISNATNNLFYCDQNNTPFLLLLIPNILQGLFFLFSVHDST